MKFYLSCCLLLVCGITGCSNPIPNPLKKEPYAWPGTRGYQERLQTFRVSPQQAFKLAWDSAKARKLTQFVSRTPTVIINREYVFSVPRGSGASLHGFYVHGDKGRVRYVETERTLNRDE